MNAQWVIIGAMEPLRSWLAAERGRASRLARHLGVPPSFIAKMASGEKAIPMCHAAPIEAFTGGAVTRQQMFPGVWRTHWPELEGFSAQTPEKEAA